MTILSPSRSERPVMTRTERLWRLKAELKARSAWTCPHCGSGALVPVFRTYYRYTDGRPEKERATDRRGTQHCADCGREFCRGGGD